ncbi:MAG TPA: ATPase [Candidatus Avanaerovorax faecigallinarum]|nr:ATPase [Candidatus Avanaerovorax faecigallinarum]
MTVLEFLEEIEDIVKNAPGLPLTGKIMVDADELLEITKGIRLSLPDDVQQAKWVRDEKDRILEDARTEYEKIIIEAKKQADLMVEKDVITQRAVEVADNIYTRADVYAKDMKLRTFNYMDEVLFNFQKKMEELNDKYFAAMYQEMDNHFAEIGNQIAADMNEIREMARETDEQEIKPHKIQIPVGDGAEE